MAQEPEQENRDARRNKVVRDVRIVLTRGVGIVQTRGVRIVLIISGGVLFIIVLWAFVGPSTPTEKQEFVRTVGILLAGLAGLGGLLLTYQNLSQTRRSTQRTLELTEQGQITERFTRAIDQLGATDEEGKPKLEIRVGGIYALERIARDSQTDYGTVMEVLTAYVRENAQWSPEVSSGPTTAANEVAGPKPPQEPPADIRAIVDVIRRPEEDRVPGKDRVALDLRRTNLEEANLEGANLEEADLEEANLEGAILVEADLVIANLIGANLRGANLEGANLEGAYLEGAILVGAYLVGAYLVGANLEEANLEGANLEGANLEEADLEEANLKRANLEEANLEEANLEEANLEEANLEEANLRIANLEGANLYRANFRRASLVGANLEGADLREAERLIHSPYART